MLLRFLKIASVILPALSKITQNFTIFDLKVDSEKIVDQKSCNFMLIRKNYRSKIMQFYAIFLRFFKRFFRYERKKTTFLIYNFFNKMLTIFIKIF